MKPDKKHTAIYFIFTKEKYCWCTQNYLWDV